MLQFFFRYCFLKNSLTSLAIWACLIRSTKVAVFSLGKILMLIWIQEVYFIASIHNMHSFLPMNQWLEFCQIRSLHWDISNKIIFYFRLIPEKSNDKNFRTLQQTKFWWYILTLFIHRHEIGKVSKIFCTFQRKVLNQIGVLDGSVNRPNGI